MRDLCGMTQNDSFDDPKSRIEIPRPNPAETDFGPHMSQNQFLREGFVRDFQCRAPSLAMQDMISISYATMVAASRRRPIPLHTLSLYSNGNDNNIIIGVLDCTSLHGAPASLQSMQLCYASMHNHGRRRQPTPRFLSLSRLWITTS